MKRTILLPLFIIFYIAVWCQNSGPSRIPCTDSLVATVKGDWIKRTDLLFASTPAEQQEAFKRLNPMHDILQKIYPHPIGVDIRWHRSIGIGYFGAKRKYKTNPNGVLTFDYLDLLSVVSYRYITIFAPHYCVHNDDGVVFARGDKNESSRGIRLIVNELAGIVGDVAADDMWLIDGLPVRMRSPVLKEKWKGYDVQVPEYGSSARYVLLNRNGELPYKPVTRKQYLDYCIIYHTKMYDDISANIKKQPVRTLEEQEAEKKKKLEKFEKDFGNDAKKLKSNVDYYLSGYQTDQQRRDESLSKIEKIKMDELKKFTDEREKSASEGLLETPAIVLVKYISAPVFETDTEKGYMLVTENPAYYRKDLPAYIPQFIVLHWLWSDYTVHREYEQIFFRDFPIEKIQAMIDK